MPPENTYPKPPEDLILLLSPDQANIFKDALKKLPLANQIVLKCTLKYSPDRVWDQLVIMSISWVLIIPGILKTTDTLPREGRIERSSIPATDCPGTICMSDSSNYRPSSAIASKSSSLKALLVKTSCSRIKRPPRMACIHLKVANNPPIKYEILLGLDRAHCAWHGSLFWDSYFVIGPGTSCLQIKAFSSSPCLSSYSS